MERIKRTGIVETDSFARERLWPAIGGEEQVVTLTRTVENAGGKLYLHGGAARLLALLKGEEVFGDLDFVVTDVNGETLEVLTKSVFANWHVKARRHRLDDLIKTVEVAAPDGQGQVADIVCARKGNRPDIEATIEDHLAQSFTPDGRLFAFEITAVEDQVSLRLIEVTRELDFDPADLRPDLVWLWFHALVTGRVPEGKRDKAQTMLTQYMSKQKDKLVLWRGATEPLDHWWARRQRVQGEDLQPSNSVKPLSVRSTGRCNVEGIADKMNSAFRANQLEFWRVGMETGILPQVFPVLKALKCIPHIQDEILANLQAKVEDDSERWLLIFGPILRESYEPVRNSAGLETVAVSASNNHLPTEVSRSPKTFEVLKWTLPALSVPWKTTALKFIGFERVYGYQDLPRKPGTLLEDRVAFFNWRFAVVKIYLMYHKDRLAKSFLKYPRRFYSQSPEKGKPPAILSAGRFARELVGEAAESPFGFYLAMTSYLPLGAHNFRKRIAEIALLGQSKAPSSKGD